MSFIEVLILSFIEGLTEFIPVSSTGHLILVGRVLEITQGDFQKAFDVIIQFGAILAVLVLYRDRFLRASLDFYKKLFIAFLPTAIIGFLIKGFVDQWMESITIVAWALIIGGLVMIAVDYFMKESHQTELSYPKSFMVGIIQCVSMIPGVSRSGATIVGGQLLGLSRKSAAEFSFFLAVPTMMAATAYKLWKVRSIIHTEQSLYLLAGVLLSFVFALLAIRFFIAIVQKYGFFWFGVYRIILGAIVLSAL